MDGFAGVGDGVVVAEIVRGWRREKRRRRDECIIVVVQQTA